MTDSKRPGKRPERSPGVISTQARDGDTAAQATARTVLRPSIGAAIATQAVYGKLIGDEYLEMGALSDELVEQCSKVHNGDLKRMESMLVAQAHTLDALFNRLTHRAMAQQYLKQYECYMRLALKAQAQARATVGALAEIKNPRPVAFVQQANLGTNVQVNNGVSRPVRARAREGIAPSGLLEASDGERLDTGTASATGRGDPTLEAVDTQHRAEDRGR